MPAKKKEDAPELMVARRKVNRGSTRRINRALEAAMSALADFEKEIDMQAFLVDDKGERAAEHPLVNEVREMSQHLRIEVFKLTNPEADPEPEAEPDGQAPE
jgi:hypothetical protein